MRDELQLLGGNGRPDLEDRHLTQDEGQENETQWRPEVGSVGAAHLGHRGLDLRPEVKVILNKKLLQLFLCKIPATK